VAEIEIRAEGEHPLDPIGQRVGVLSAFLAIGLAIVTIFSHRSHTESIMLKSEANDQWSHYQATRIKLHSWELGRELISTLGPKDDSTGKAVARFTADAERYEASSERLKQGAEEVERRAEKKEKHALRLDLGEAFLDIGLVMTSLYFISRKRYFPWMGAVAGVSGVAIALSAALL
jgi:hypothetical protein